MAEASANLESSGCIIAVSFPERREEGRKWRLWFVETPAHLKTLGVGMLIGSGHRKVKHELICYPEPPPHLDLSPREVRASPPAV